MTQTAASIASFFLYFYQHANPHLVPTPPTPIPHPAPSPSVYWKTQCSWNEFECHPGHPAGCGLIDLPHRWRLQSQAAEWWISTSGARTRGSGSVKCINSAPALLIMQDEKVVDMLLCGSLNDSPGHPGLFAWLFLVEIHCLVCFWQKRKKKQQQKPSQLAYEDFVCFVNLHFKG